MSSPPVPPTLLEVRDLRKHFPIRKGFFKRHVGDVLAVDGVSFDIRRGETLGLVGESGCGKTTTGRLLVGAYKPTAGSIRYLNDGMDLQLESLSHRELRSYWRKAQMIFQDPYSSLNSRQTVMQIVEEPLVCMTEMSRAERDHRVRELLDLVGLNPQYAERYPHAFSGGQRQRIGVARALAIGPEVVVADEAVSALDVSIQAQVVNLLVELQRKLDLAYLFISHDLGVVKHVSRRVAVMYVGKIVELADADALFEKPRHPYTEALLSAVPQPDTKRSMKRIVLSGDVADPAHRPAGCAFHPRCPYAEQRCRIEEPELRVMQTGDTSRTVACHFAEQLELRGVHAGLPGV